MNNQREDKLASLFRVFTGHHPDKMQKLTASGSNRSYYRITRNSSHVIGTIGENQMETKVFLYLSEHFRKKGLQVPTILASNEKENIYLQQDLGDTSLFTLLEKDKKGDKMSGIVKALYKRSVEELIRFQLDGGEGLDFSYCWPKETFDRQAIMWDINYFKYYFLKPSGVTFDEQKLEDDFEKLTDFLLLADATHFMYRDFQSRNILVFQNEPWFIDYQGGRRGALQYDLASLLFQAKGDFSPFFREEMLQYYLEMLSKRLKINRKKFVEHYYGFVLIRTLQVLGAYGYRGFFEQKPHFIESAGFALNNLKWFLENIILTITLPHLTDCLNALVSENIRSVPLTDKLTLEINSFSYKKSGIPKDPSGHGGGFVFDCRSLPNPGRFIEYTHLTGNDEPVIQFLAKEPEVGAFLDSVSKMVEQSIGKYLERGFSRLMVSFGCTGGQHRSVYCANQLAIRLSKKQGVKVLIRHRMQE